MKKRTRFPLLFRILTIISGVVFAAAAGFLVFFDLTDYGFLYSDALRWVCFVSFISLLIGLTVWLCRCVLMRKAIKALVSVACVLLALAWSFGWLFGIVTMLHAGEITSTRAGRISGNRYYMHTSPEGTNQFVLIITVHGGDMFYAYPMLNRWIYKEVEQRPVLVWDWPEYTDEYTVEWPSEQQAVVTVIWLPDDPDGLDRIVVDFSNPVGVASKPPAAKCECVSGGLPAVPYRLEEYPHARIRNPLRHHNRPPRQPAGGLLHLLSLRPGAG